MSFLKTISFNKKREINFSSSDFCRHHCFGNCGYFPNVFIYFFLLLEAIFYKEAYPVFQVDAVSKNNSESADFLRPKKENNV